MEFEDKIKKLEKRTTGSISNDYDINANDLFASYTEQEVDED